MADEIIIYKVKQDQIEFIRNRYKDMPKWILMLSEFVRENVEKGDKKDKL